MAMAITLLFNIVSVFKHSMHIWIKILVSRGDRIKQNQLIGTIGNTGASTGSHLHYEIIKNKEKIDPKPHLISKGTSLKKL
ncbi:M23 family metallopeptidase [Tenacibaculum sp. MAR_2009_124]|uniref:M23 family metallopeptidase n=1 Tax=Tenacibaculum sp. MAR_2009_124 TaxID=1250059 RepID=UPI000B85BEF3